MEFTDKFIAFIDILGFKGIVADSEAGRGLPLTALLELLTLLGTGDERDRFERSTRGWCPSASRITDNLDFCVTQISDCAVISAEVSPAGVVNLAAHCWEAAMGLLRKGFMCRGYITRGQIYHTAGQFIGSGYQDAYSAEGVVTVFQHDARDSGTPFIQIDSKVVDFVDACTDPCVREVFGRCTNTDGRAFAIFPFKRLSHSFIVAGNGHVLDTEKERRSNRNLRGTIESLRARVAAHVDATNDRALRKLGHYVASLDAQLAVCDKTDAMLDRWDSMNSPSGSVPPQA